MSVVLQSTSKAYSKMQAEEFMTFFQPFVHKLQICEEYNSSQIIRDYIILSSQTK